MTDIPDEVTIVATYRLWNQPEPEWGQPWTDMPEAKPRCRARLSSEEPDAAGTVEVKSDGTIETHGQVEVDYYPGMDTSTF
jgi:hypothetical protein